MSDPFVPGGLDPAIYVGWLERLLVGLRPMRLGKRFGLLHRRRDAVLLAGLERAADRPGVVMEFGVFKGRSISTMAQRAPQRSFLGFDSFEGFPDDGRTDWNVDFSVDGMPAVPANVALHKGWFADTVPAALLQLNAPVAMVHVDCDIFSSTCDALGPLADRGLISPGLIMVCDDAINYPAFAFNELLGVYSILKPLGLDLAPLAVHDRVRSLTETLNLFRAGLHPQMNTDRTKGFFQQAAFTVVERTLPESEGSEEGVALFAAELGTRRRERAGARPGVG